MALNNSYGTYVCLVNPDTILDFNVIDKLLFSILSDGDAAVSVPKIVFYEKFIDLDIFSDKPFFIDLEILDKSLKYKKYFIRDGHESAFGDYRREVHANNNHIKFCLPVDNSKAILKVFKLHKDLVFNYKINNSIINNSKIINEINQNSSSTDIHLNLDKDLIWWGRDMINNAGSGLRDGRPFDRGFAEYDVGQYNFSEKVFLPIENAKLPSLSFLISIDLFLILSTAFDKSSETVPIFGLGIRPFGPSIFPNFPIFAIIEGVQINLSKLISLSEIFFNKSSDPTTSAPLFLASLNLLSSHNIATFIFFPLPCGISIKVLRLLSAPFIFLRFIFKDRSIDSSNLTPEPFLSSFITFKTSSRVMNWHSGN